MWVQCAATPGFSLAMAILEGSNKLAEVGSRFVSKLSTDIIFVVVCEP